MSLIPYHIAIEPIEAIGDYLQRHGHDAEAFLRQQGYSDDNDGYVDFQLFSRLFDAAERLTGDPCIGLNVGAHFLARHWGRLGYLIMAGENGLEGVHFIQRFARIVTNALDLRWHWDAGTLQCDFSILVPNVSRHVCDYFVSSSLSLSKATHQDVAPFHTVFFQHDDGGCAERYVQMLECECRFNAPWNRILVERQNLHRESRLRDPRLKKILEEHAEQVLQKLASTDELIGQVRQRILQQLPNGVPALKEISEQLGQNERTFQRTLARLGHNYQDMVDELRMNLALEYIRNDYNFLDIAMLLGYSEQSAFHRAFKRWTGQPPSRFKKNQAASS